MDAHVAFSRVRAAVLSITNLGSFSVPQAFFWSLLLGLAAILGDQSAAPVLSSSSPLWAIGCCVLLVLRRGAVAWGAAFPAPVLRVARVVVFFAAHIVLILTARAMTPWLQLSAGSDSALGWLVAALKLSVLAPGLVFFPFRQWQLIARTYSAELWAALLVLITFFPRREIESLWPWYGQLLGRAVFHVSQVFASGLGYIKELTPTVTGPGLDVTILLSCSGINGIELFQILFAFVVFVDWPRLNKSRTPIAYFAGMAAMLLGNLLRLISFVVLGNHGFADFLSRFHISAGWIFFSLLFLLFLSISYRWLLDNSGHIRVKN